MDKALVFIILAYTGGCFCSERYGQERAEVKYVNPKYLWNATAYTGRQKRGEAYRTNVTATILHPWGNNVTFELSYKLQLSPTPFIFKIKLCEILKLKWLMDFVKQFADVKITCPIPAGTYRFNNLEFPPKNFPLPVPKGNLRLKSRHYITATMEVMLEVTGLIYVP